MIAALLCRISGVTILPVYWSVGLDLLLSTGFTTGLVFSRWCYADRRLLHTDRQTEKHNIEHIVDLTVKQRYKQTNKLTKRRTKWTYLYTCAHLHLGPCQRGSCSSKNLACCDNRVNTTPVNTRSHLKTDKLKDLINNSWTRNIHYLSRRDTP